MKGAQVRRLSLGLPSGAMTITNHPPATVVLRQVEAHKTIQTGVTRGQFGLAFPLVPKVNTLDWSLRTAVLNWTAPSLSFNVQ